ncbi:phospholipase A1 member A-like [Schistocerca serialis cubense]|uniref:phospholipase A1 member A-like n=1 Tax=Schistocerca serialis cubense TaxID=2023355 RepID=UPI00214DFE95|nr:phospholipase A1 member A-like [Schistocerca serialis cubense]
MDGASPRLLLLPLALLAAAGPAGCSASLWVVHMGPCPLVLGGDCPDPAVRFFLFTGSGDDADRVQVDGSDNWAGLDGPWFDPSLPTKVIVHGYNSGMDIQPLAAIRNAYLRRGGHNVLSVDWTALSPGPCYPMAAHNARFAGRCLAGLVRALTTRGATDVHVVGFSVGAHVAAYAANSLRPYKLPRITGLDPALPLFVTANRDHKLDASDALLVDVLHTNALVQGKLERCGHADFYLNGGVDQPGCGETSDRFGCSHHRAPLYFAESVTAGRDASGGFWGWRCGGLSLFLLGLCPARGDQVLMGEFLDPRQEGFFVVQTASSPPFALGRWRSSDPYRQHTQPLPVALPAGSADDCEDEDAGRLLRMLLGDREPELVLLP